MVAGTFAMLLWRHGVLKWAHVLCPVLNLPFVAWNAAFGKRVAANHYLFPSGKAIPASHAV